jgi:hypothetical protein
MIWRDRTRIVTFPNGSAEQVTDVPLFEAKFRTGRLTEIERRAAAKQFSMGVAGLGEHDTRGVAQPYREDGIVIGAVGSAGDAYSGYDPQFHMSSYDTEVDIPFAELGCFTDEERSEARKVCEDRLLASPDIPSSLVVINERTVPAPWKNYNKITGATRAKKIVSVIVETGIDVDEVLEFEREAHRTEPREDVLAALVELKAEQDEQTAREAIEKAALQVTVR